MHQAPSVIYPMGPGVFLHRLATGLVLLALGVQLFWIWTLWAGSGAGWRILLGAVSLVGAAGMMARAWRQWPRGELRWLDGGWHWHASGMDDAAPLPAGKLRVSCDFQSALLLRWQFAQEPCATRWVWVERRSCPARWMDLRRAVHAARPSEENGEAGG